MKEEDNLDVKRNITKKLNMREDGVKKKRIEKYQPRFMKVMWKTQISARVNLKAEF